MPTLLLQQENDDGTIEFVPMVAVPAPDGSAAVGVVVSGFGLTGVAHNRNVAIAGDATEHVTWTTAENVREVTIRGFQTTDEVSQSDTGSLIVVNAPSEAIADTWLADAGAGAQDVLYEAMLQGESLVIQRTSPITRVSILSIDSARRFAIAGVGVLS